MQLSYFSTTFFLFLLFATTIIIISSAFTTTTKAQVVSSYYGTYYEHFPAFDNLNLTALTAEPTSIVPGAAFHLHLFEPPSPTFASLFSSTTVMIVPICVAVNATAVVGSKEVTFDISLETLGLWMRGLLPDYNTSLSPHDNYIGTAQFKLVLAADAATTRAVLHRFVQEGIPGFTSAVEFPPEVLANSNITWVADDFAVIDKLHEGSGGAEGLVSFVSVAHGEFFDCAAIRIPSPNRREVRISYPNDLADADPGRFTLEEGTYNFTHSIETGHDSIYPLYGSVLISFPADSLCIHAARNDFMIEFMKTLFAKDIFFARLKQWGMLALNPQLKITILSNLVKTLPCVNTKVVPAGGSSAVEEVMSSWVLSYLDKTSVLIDYNPFGSGQGQQGIKDRNLRFAGSDSPLTISDYAAYFTAGRQVRLFPVIGLGVSVVVNLPGIKNLYIPKCALLQIFSGTLQYWNNPLLQNFNPFVALPNERIKLIIKTSSSGTTSIFTNALRETDKLCWFQQYGIYASSVVVTSTWNLAVTAGHAHSSTSTMIEDFHATPYSISFLSTPTATADSTITSAWLVNETTRDLSFPTTDLVQEAIDATKFKSVVTGEVDITGVAGTANGWAFSGVSYFIFESGLGGANCSEIRQAIDFIYYVMFDPIAKAAALTHGFVPLSDTFTTNGYQKLVDSTCGNYFMLPQLRVNVTSSQLSTAAMAGIGVGGASFLIILAILFFFLANRGKKSNKHAAKDAKTPMALVFTDIQASTSLWSLAPQAMAKSLDIHNDIIDNNISKFDAYKVKTIGDAYMICIKDIKNAHAMCMSIQRDLYNAEWPSDEIDLVYAEIFAEPDSAYQRFNPDGSDKLNDLNFNASKHRANVATSELYKNRLDNNFFRGVSIRVGMTWGVAEPREDEVTGQYDYFGPTVNLASRCESCGNGGQTIYSVYAIDALREAGIDLTDTQQVSVNALGKQLLKGIPMPVELYQVLPPEFAGRLFPPLRLDNDGGALAQETLNSTHGGNTLGTNSQSDHPDADPRASKYSQATSSAVGTKGGGTTGGGGGADDQNSTAHTTASTLAEDEFTDSRVAVDIRFAKFISKESRSEDPRLLLLMYDTLASVIAATPKESQRKEIITKIASDWRIRDTNTKHHQYFKKELGFEQYWQMRISSKIYGATKIRSKKRDPEGLLGLCAFMQSFHGQNGTHEGQGVVDSSLAGGWFGASQYQGGNNTAGGTMSQRPSGFNQQHGHSSNNNIYISNASADGESYSSQHQQQQQSNSYQQHGSLPRFDKSQNVLGGEQQNKLSLGGGGGGNHLSVPGFVEQHHRQQQNRSFNNSSPQQTTSYGNNIYANAMNKSTNNATNVSINVESVSQSSANTSLRQQGGYHYQQQQQDYASGENGSGDGGEAKFFKDTFNDNPIPMPNQMPDVQNHQGAGASVEEGGTAGNGIIGLIQQQSGGGGGDGNQYYYSSQPVSKSSMGGGGDGKGDVGDL